MAVRIRMKRVGAKNAPYFRIVVADSRSPRDGKFIEEIGTYQPLKKGENVQDGSGTGQVLDQQRRATQRNCLQLFEETRQSGRRGGLDFYRLMQAFLEYVVKGLVDHPEAATVTPVVKDALTIYELRLHPDDVGKVIGRQGMTINAMRSLLLAGSAKKGCVAPWKSWRKTRPRGARTAPWREHEN